MLYKVTIVDGKNLPLTKFQRFWQVMGRYCSYLLPRQVDGTFHIQVNGRFFTVQNCRPVENQFINQ